MSLFGNWRRGKRVGLDQNVRFGLVQFPDDGIGAASVGGEIDFPGEGLILGEGGGWRKYYPKKNSEDDN